MIRPLHQHADLRGGPFAGIEDADPVIGQTDFADAGQRGKAFPEAGVERVDRAVAVSRFNVIACASADAHGGGGAGLLLPAADDHDFVSLNVEELRARIERLADEELERPIGGFEVIALVLGFLDPVHEGPAGVV